MTFSRRTLLGAIAAGSTGLISPRVFAAVKSDSRPDLLRKAMAALDTHSSRIPHRDLIGLVDFSVPSAVPRLQLVDVAGGRVISHHLVAHGKGSDPANTGVVQKFSNRPGSNASSHGAFLTANSYYGKHGKSRRLIGLDPENDNALARAIVIHSASYVDPIMARSQGRIGRSLGCFTLTRGDLSEVLSRLGEGRMLFAAR
ncbi:twin-arginine translocation pathway signal protein [Novosphingobium sp. PC22D]|uniref:murein L,D-transpeptidase catalytic domain family protein n=1 Tax=Novosphingobium sp. PC22D TaxID=1962403 RepID=UPI000BF149FD|nr:murein L,D-transpeptidase catalytic domain family protein [Novosphingobium sp. PC22D]PEQ13792.1 twin-arginine translocation pathway signal protein [Novosphingobium sp. PC22D]